MKTNDTTNIKPTLRLYENDDFIVIPEYGWGGDCEWEYYVGGYECDNQFEYAILDKNYVDSDGALFHSGHLCSTHIHDVWTILTQHRKARIN